MERLINSVCPPVTAGCGDRGVCPVPAHTAQPALPAPDQDRQRGCRHQHCQVERERERECVRERERKCE